MRNWKGGVIRGKKLPTLEAAEEAARQHPAVARAEMGYLHRRQAGAKTRTFRILAVELKPECRENYLLGGFSSCPRLFAEMGFLMKKNLVPVKVRPSRLLVVPRIGASPHFWQVRVYAAIGYATGDVRRTVGTLEARAVVSPRNDFTFEGTVTGWYGRFDANESLRYRVAHRCRVGGEWVQRSCEIVAKPGCPRPAKGEQIVVSGYVDKEELVGVTIARVPSNDQPASRQLHELARRIVGGQGQETAQ